MIVRFALQMFVFAKSLYFKSISAAGCPMEFAKKIEILVIRKVDEKVLGSVSHVIHILA